MTMVSVAAPKRLVEVTIDGVSVSVTEGSTILDACRRLGISTPTLCYADTLTPVNVCRVCVVELENARTLVPACSRKVEPGMIVLAKSATQLAPSNKLANSASESRRPALPVELNGVSVSVNGEVWFQDGWSHAYAPPNHRISLGCYPREETMIGAIWSNVKNVAR